MNNNISISDDDGAQFSELVALADSMSAYKLASH